MAGFDDDQEQRGPGFAPPNEYGSEDRSSVQDSEANPDTADTGSDESKNLLNYSSPSSEPDTHGEGLKGAASRAASFFGKHKTGMGIGTGVGVAGAMLGLLFSIATGPITFMKVVLNDLDDQVSILTSQSDGSSRVRLKTATAEVAKGCGTIMSVRCRLKSLSSKEVTRLESKGIKVNAKYKVGGRTFPESYTYEGNKLDAKAFAKEFASNKGLRAAYRSAMNMKFFGFYDKASAWVRERLKAPKTKANIDEKGDSQEEMEKLAKGESGEALDTDTGNVRTTDEDGKPLENVTGEDGKPVQGLDSAKTQADIALKTGTGVAANLVQNLNTLGNVDMACTIRNMIGAASVAAKAVRYAQLAAYAAPIAASVYAIYAGVGTVKDGEVIGKFFQDPDTREVIADQAAIINDMKTTYSADGSVSSVDETTKANPDKGKSAMDASFYKLSAGYGSATEAASGTAKYSLGMSSMMVAGALAGIASFTNFGGLSKGLCKAVQNWFVRGLGLVTGIVSIFVPGAGEVNIGKNIAFFAGFIAAFYFLQQFLATITSGNAVDTATIDQASVERGTATQVGIHAITSATNQVHGMIPASAEQIVAYRNSSESIAIANDYKLAERQGSAWYDLSNPSSFGSEFVAAIQTSDSNNQSLPGQLASVFSLLTNSSNTLLSTTNSVYADSEDITRYQQCGDETYTELGVAADVDCGLRYYVPAKTLDLVENHQEEVLDYMEDKGFVDKDTTTGLPPGYTEPSATESQNFVTNLVNGFVDQFYATRNYSGKGGEYAKYLDWCVYRTAPWGETYEESSGIGAAGSEWTSGTQCLKTADNKASDIQMDYFRAYRIILSGIDITEKGEGEASATQATTSGDTCAANTKSLGVYDKAHDNGEQISIELCELSSIKLQSGFYTTQDPAIFSSGSGGLIVGASVSDAFQKLGERAKAEDRQLVGKGIRSYEKQQYFYNCYINKNCNNGNLAAVPGTSNHENGTAVDFVLGSGDLAWLRENGSKFNLKELTGGSQPEPWHWSPIGE